MYELHHFNPIKLDNGGEVYLTSCVPVSRSFLYYSIGSNNVLKERVKDYHGNKHLGINYMKHWNENYIIVLNTKYNLCHGVEILVLLF